MILYTQQQENIPPATMNHDDYQKAAATTTTTAATSSSSSSSLSNRTVMNHNNSNRNSNSNNGHNSHVVATTAALEAAEEFIEKMDDAFATLDQSFDDDDEDGNYNNIIRDEIQDGAEDEVDDFDFDVDTFEDDKKEVEIKDNGSTMHMNSISNAIYEIEQSAAAKAAAAKGVIAGVGADGDSNNIIINQHDSRDSDTTNSTQLCLSSSSSTSPPFCHDEINEDVGGGDGEGREEDLVLDSFVMNQQHHSSMGNVLDVVQEEPEEEEEEEDKDDNGEESQCPQQQQQQQQQQENNMNWDDDNGFFDFTDEENEDGQKSSSSSSLIESPLLSPMPVPTTSINHDQNKPPPQDQPEQVVQQDVVEIQNDDNNDQEEEDDEHDKELITTESTETNNILISSSIDTIPSSNQTSSTITTISPTKLNITSPQPTPSSVKKTLTYMYAEQSKSDQLAQSHAEDVLSLTLELQTLRSQLQAEKDEHIKTKSYLEKEETKSVQMEIKLQELQNEMVDLRNVHEEEMIMLQEENELYKSKMEEAEEDAQQALAIAKESDLKVGEMEEFLQKALDEVEQLRVEQANSLPMISEQEHYENDGYGDNNSNYETPQRHQQQRGRRLMVSSCSPYRRDRMVDRAVVAIGRNLLRQVNDSDDMSSASNNSSTYEGSTTSNSSYLVTLTRRSAEKRQKLRDSMMNRSTAASTSTSAEGSDPTGKEVVCFSSLHSNNGLDLGYGSAFIATVKSVSKIMRQSGKRLNLGGRWFNGPNSSSIRKKRQGSSDADDLDLESLTRNYCKSVEALVSKQREEVKELKQFCGFLEEKLEYK